jgi:class 3 adenylate cyclase/tetratricopeptide (TPR) repeat protein
MTFEEQLKEALGLLRRQGKVSYRALKRHLGVDDACVADLKSEIIDVLGLAVDQGGTVLVWTGGGPPSDAAGSGTHEVGERRLLTVMFCDLVNSTSLAARLDPEDFRDVVCAYQEAVAGVIGRLGGHIAQYLGDGILVYFGYPIAHDDDAVRAVRASLDTVDAMAPVNARFQASHDIPVAVRIGLHTGTVVIGQVGGADRHELLAVGETPNIAARVQTLAPSGGVVVTDATWRVAGGYFAAEELGKHALKGIAVPVTVHRVLHESGARTRVEAEARRGLTTLVGREHELDVLLDRFARAEQGGGQAVFFVGEPGIGKSRLVDAVEARVASRAPVRLSFRCSPFHTNSALHPVIDHLQRTLDLQRTDSPDAKLAKLEAALRRREDPERDLPVIASLLSLKLPDGRAAEVPADPQQLKQRTMETLKGWLLEHTKTRPLFAVFEDVHWADPSTLELLGQTIAAIADARALFVLTSRPGFANPWSALGHVTTLGLGRLERTQTESMIRAIAHGKSLPSDVVDVVVAKTEGVPLFTEELVKMILESDLLREESDRYDLVRPLPTMTIPTTLQNSLMARLDRLNGAKEIAQIGATFGREFSHEMIAVVSERSAAVLSRELARLVDAELLSTRGTPPTYTFRHALIRDAAYESLLKSRRRGYHKRIAETLDAQADARDTQPELLAYHYGEAKIVDAAVVCWQKAGQRAIRRSANAEAIAYLGHGLDMVRELPESEERNRIELSLCAALAVPLIATKGYASPDVQRTYGRARELALRVGESPELPDIVWGMWVYYLTGGPIRSALSLAEQYRALADRLQREDLLLETCQVMGIAHFYMGQCEDARPFLERGCAMYDPSRHHALIFAHGGADTGVALKTHAALALWTLGYPDKAHAAMSAALATAESVSHPFSLAFAHYFCAWLHKLCHDDERVRASASAAVAICDEHGFPFWGLVSAALHGSTLVGDETTEGIAAIRKSLASYEASGAALYQPELLGLLASSLARTGRAEEGFATCQEGFAAMERSDERWCHAELHRESGELHVALGRPVEAEASLQKALEVARAQGARSWELRAATSLARLLDERGRGDEGRATLAAAYGAFTEGFETYDLRAAAALLGR